ncbi:MAG: hypothetical protein E6J53_10110 [Chloroflexi bacterium]|nr:MAG: hypothetical protein E6J53_10110 [Chloroflexota bacterium]
MLADQRMTNVKLQVVGAAEVITRLADVDADHLGDIRVLDQALDEQGTPPSGHAGNENSSLFGHS